MSPPGLNHEAPDATRVQKLKHQSGVSDQSSQEYEHEEKPKDLSHAKLLLGKLPQARVQDTLRRHGEGGRGLRSNHLPRSKGRPSSCKDDVDSLRGVLATLSRPFRTQAAEEEVSSLL